MKKNLSLLGLAIGLNGVIAATGPINLDQDKPARIYVASYETTENLSENYDWELSTTNTQVSYHADDTYHYGWHWDSAAGGSGTLVDKTVVLDDFGDWGGLWLQAEYQWPSNSVNGTVVSHLQEMLEDGSWDDWGYFPNSSTLPGIPWEHCDVTLAGTASSPGPNGSYTDALSAARKAQTKIRLQTGGKAASNRRNLFRISGSAARQELTYGGHYAPNIISTPWSPEIWTQDVEILGQHLVGGSLYVVLTDNTDVDLTPHIAGADCYTFNVNFTKHTPYISANGKNLTETTNEFCVGQQITFQLAWDVTPPQVVNTIQQWTLPAKFVNESYAHSSICTSYRVNGGLLTNNPTQCWYVNGTGGRANVSQRLNFLNGQSASLAVQGDFTIYRPTVSNFTPLLNGVSWNAPILKAEMSWNVRMNSKYDGEHGITQLLLGTGFYYDTDGEYVLDGDSEIYGEPEANGPSPYSVSNSATHVLRFLDTPSAPATPCVDMDIKFNTYLRFKPTGGIFVTIATNSWYVDAAACLTGPSKTICPPATSYGDDDAFPVWNNKRSE